MIAVLPSHRPEQASLTSIVSALRLVGHEVDFVAIRIFDGLARWHGRTSERATLATMDERMRKDIGVLRADIAREAGKPFWRA